MRYNFFKDFHHTVYAAWQLYCLYHNQPDLIKRWQVFGNHETLEINQQDKKYTCGSFVLMMSNIRQYILPTEIDFINKEKREIISLSHAFGARYGLPETHECKKIHNNFKIMYLKSHPQYKEDNLTKIGAYGHHIGIIKTVIKNSFHDEPKSFKDLPENTYKRMNPQLWTDYRPGLHDLDLSNKDTQFEYKANDQRGYNVRGNINDLMLWRKKIVLENFKFLELVDCDDFTYFHVSGHTHGGEDTTKLLFQSQQNVFSFSHLLHFAKDSSWLFTACSCHNTYGMDLANFTEEKAVFFDCLKPDYPISAFETVDNYQRFCGFLKNNPSKESISPLFINYLKELSKERVIIEEKYDKTVDNINSLEKQITFSSNLLSSRLLYFAFPAAGYLVGSKFKKHKKEMYFMSLTLAGIKCAYFIMDAHRKTLENKKGLAVCRNQRDFFSKSLEKNKFMDDKRSTLFTWMPEKLS